MNNWDKILAYINPMFFYYSIVYAVSKIYEVIFDTESVWQNIWNKILIILGDDVEFYSVWVLNSYSYLLYWLFGASLVLMETYKIPKKLNSYKIQEKKDQLKGGEKLYPVRLFTYPLRVSEKFIIFLRIC